MDLQLHMPFKALSILHASRTARQSSPHLVDLMLIDLADGMLDFTTFPSKIFNLKETKVYELFTNQKILVQENMRENFAFSFK